MSNRTNTLRVFLAKVGILYRQTRTNGLRWGYFCMVAGSMICRFTFAVLVPTSIMALWFRDHFFTLLLLIDILLLLISILIGFFAYGYLQRLVIRVSTESNQISP